MIDELELIRRARPEVEPASEEVKRAARSALGRAIATRSGQSGMSERDPIVTPRLAQTNGAHARHGTRLPHGVLPARLRRPLLAGAAAALGVAAIAIAVVVASRPSPASALDVIRQARAAFAHTPPFQAVIKAELNPTGSYQFTPRAATQTLLVSYGGPRQFRLQVLGQQPRLRRPFAPPPGAYEVFDGQRLGSYDPRRPKIFESNAVSGFSPLAFLSWHGAYPDWERVCRGPDSRVFPDARIAGRDARHIRCENFAGDTWQLWIDRQTGLLLKLVGRVGGGGDTFLGGGISTSATGGFEVERLRYDPTFSGGTFSVTAPPGAFDAGALRRATLAKVPPFRAVIAVNDGRRVGSYVDEGWWLNERTWRSQTLVDHQRGRSGPDPNDSRSVDFTGAGSFSVMAHGIEMIYNAHDHTFTSNVDDGGDAGPVDGLLGYLGNGYSPARCPVVGHERIAGRETDHRRCASDELWIDSATGLALRAQDNGHDVLVVRSIEYRPQFPAGIFRFVPPPGSHDLARLEKNPYYKTKLAPGKPAPNWNATTLDGKPFQLTDLRGKPTLLLLTADWCGCEFYTFAPLEQAYRHSKAATRVVWVDSLPGSMVSQLRKLARLNRLTFPIVVDRRSRSIKAWGSSIPYWLLLDGHGRVIAARLGLQTVTRIEQLLGKG
jgi:hypothetical protein